MDAFLASIPHLLLVVVVAGVVGVESVGLPLPGETILITALLISQVDGVPAWWIFAAAAGGAIVGDNLGYLIGRYAGVPILELLRRRLPHVVTTESIVAGARLMARYGVWAVFAARFVALLRILSGPLAGTMRMRYPSFLIANAGGAILWAGAVTLVVTIAGAEARELLHRASWVLLLVAVLAVLVLVVVVVIRRRRRASRPANTLSADDAAKPLAQLLAEVAERESRRAPDVERPRG